MEEQQGKICSKCGVWKSLDEFCKDKSKKDGKKSQCKECEKQTRRNNRERRKEYEKQYYKDNKDKIKQRYENNKEKKSEYNKRYRKINKDKINKRMKQWNEANKEHIKEYQKQWRGNNPEYIKQYSKQYRDVNKEKIKDKLKEYFNNNKEVIYEKAKMQRRKKKEENIKNIAQLLTETKSIFEKIPIYGYIYKIENIKTRHVYIGQSIQTLKARYHNSNIIQGWIDERKNRYDNQKFKEELIEEDFILDIIDCGICKYHLDKLEAYYINEYDSYNNGYNNCAGNHDTVDGIEEFNQILKENGLQFIDGKLIAI